MHRLAVSLAALVAFLAGVAPARAQILRVIAGQPGSETKTDQPATPLVRTEFNYLEAIDRAKTAIQEKDYARAIQFLQGLIETDDGGFFRQGENLYVPLHVEATRLLGTMGPEGLAQYRRLYDPKAQAKFRRAMADGDLHELVRLCQRYRHTTVAPEAMRTLAAIQLDRGRFTAAVRTLEQLLAGATSEQRAELLGMLAVAETLDGHSANARKRLAALRASHPKATATWGGRERPIVEWVDRFIASRREAAPASRPTTSTAPAMEDLLLSPRWRYPPPEDDLATFVELVAANGICQGYARSGGFLAQLSQGRVYARPQSARGNRAYLGSSRINPADGETAKLGKAICALIHPRILGDEVIFRDDEAVRAVDLYTGQLVWQTDYAMPTERMPETRGRNVYYGSSNIAIGLDQGRYAVAVGGGRIYTIYNYPQPMRLYSNQPASTDKASSLAALSSRAQGKLLWSVGKDGVSNGENELLEQMTYVSLPAYRPAQPGQADRLYVIGLYRESYCLLCLRADTGALIWKTDVSQAAADSQANRLDFIQGLRLMGTPPVLSGGRVFVLTNAGVIAAFGAEKGEPVWAYQYDSMVAVSGNTSIYRGQALGAPGTPNDVVNPIAVLDGCLVALPSDGDVLLGLSPEDGRKIWSRKRDEVHRIAVLDEDRLAAFESSKAYVIQARDGRTLRTLRELEGLNGVPADVPGGMLFSGQGRVYLMDAESYDVRSFGPVGDGGLLGNLAAKDGKLVAGNAAGVCGYFGLSAVRDELTERMKSLPPAGKADLLNQRGRLAFMAARYDDALKDYAAARKLAEGLGEGSRKDELLASLEPRLYRAHVAVGNHAEGETALAVRREHFEAAMKLAETAQQRVHMKIRLAKLLLAEEKYAEACRLTHEIAQEFADEKVTDVEIGPDVDDRRPMLPKQFGLTAWEWAHGQQGLIPKIIELHGRECYAALDAEAKTAYEAAAAKEDIAALRAIEERWPESKYVTPALFVAAEIGYRKAEQGGPGSKEALGETKALLSRIYGKGRREDNALWASATVGSYAIYVKEGLVYSAPGTRRELEALDPKTHVKFADIEGPLGEVLDRIDARQATAKAAPAEAEPDRAPALPKELALQWRIKDAETLLFCDADLRAVFVGNAFLVQKGDETLLVDATAESVEKAVRWSVKAGLTLPRSTSYRVSGVGLVAGVDENGQRLVVSDGTNCAAILATTGQVLWKQTFEGGAAARIAIGDELLVAVGSRGHIRALSTADGKTAWEAQLPVPRNRSAAVGVAPTIVHGTVLVPYSNGRSLAVYNVRTGKLIDRIESGQEIQIRVLPKGRVAVMADGKLAVHAMPGGDWSKAFEAKLADDPHRRLLGASGRHVITATNGEKPAIEAIALGADGRPGEVRKLPPPTVDGKPRTAVTALVGSDQVIVLAQGLPGTIRNTQAGALSLLRGVLACGYDLSGSPQWTTPLSEATPQSYYQVTAAELTAETVVVSVRSLRNPLSVEAVMVDRASGAVLQRIPGAGAGGAVGLDRIRHRQIGAIGVVASRLVLEDADGVSVWGGKK